MVLVQALLRGCGKLFGTAVAPVRFSFRARQHRMRPLLHLLSIILVLPGVAFAGVFIILGRAIATGSLLGFFRQLIAAALWLLPWGLLAAFVALLALVLGGLSNRFRWLAASCVAALAIASTAVVLVLTASRSNFSLEQLWFFVPALVSALLGLWLAITERPRSKRASYGA